MAAAESWQISGTLIPVRFPQCAYGVVCACVWDCFTPPFSTPLGCFQIYTSAFIYYIYIYINLYKYIHRVGERKREREIDTMRALYSLLCVYSKRLWKDAWCWWRWSEEGDCDRAKRRTGWKRKKKCSRGADKTRRMYSDRVYVAYLAVAAAAVWGTGWIFSRTYNSPPSVNFAHLYTRLV